MQAYPRSRIFVYSGITLLTLVTDLTSKTVVFEKLGGVFQRTGWLIDTWLKFELHTSLNAGALWGMGQGMAPAFAALSVGALFGINYWLFLRGGAESRWLNVALAFISGGTLGNLYDRLAMHGVCFPDSDVPAQAVRDFLAFRFGSYDYPIFNLADSFLVTGAIMLIIHSMRAEPAHSSTAQDTVRRDS